MLLALVLAGAALTAVDCLVSYKRLKLYGPIVELNEVARELSKRFGPKAGIGFIAGYNAAVLSLLYAYNLSHGLAAFVGVKLGVNLMQLKSLQVESWIEQVLSRAKAKLDSAK